MATFGGKRDEGVSTPSPELRTWSDFHFVPEVELACTTVVHNPYAQPLLTTL